MNESKLEEQFKKLQELAKHDKSIDVAGLMMKALDSHQDNYIPIKEKRWAYLSAIAVPFVGFVFVIRFLMSDKEDALQTAMVCTILSCLCLILTAIVSHTLTAGLGAQGGQGLQDINPSDVYDLIN